MKNYCVRHIYDIAQQQLGDSESSSDSSLEILGFSVLMLFRWFSWTITTRVELFGCNLTHVPEVLEAFCGAGTAGGIDNLLYATLESEP